MIQKKVCLLGAFAVGKTSLVRRFVSSMFSERYHTTVGVKIDRKTVTLGAQDVSLILWDIHGEDAFQAVSMTYLRGAAGCVLVVDGTRRETLDTAVALQERVEREVGEVPFVVVLNKADLRDEWELDESAADGLTARGWTVLTASAKSGLGVEEMFRALAVRLVGG